MALPGGITPITVTGHVANNKGVPAASGTVTFRMPYALADGPDHVVLAPGVWSFPIGSDGSIDTSSDPMPAASSAGVTPAGWSYEITIRATMADGSVWYRQFFAVISASASFEQLLAAASATPSPAAAYLPLAAVGVAVPPLVAGIVPPQYLPAGSGGGVQQVHANPDGTIVVDNTDTTNPIVGVGSIAVSKVAGLTGQLAAKADLVGGKVPQSQMPAVALTDYLGAVASQAAMLALTGQRGDWCTRTDLGTDWQLIADDPTQLANWREHTYPASPVQSVNGRTGAIVLAQGDVGLGNVNNTSDLNKPVSTAQQAALDGKVNLSLVTAKGSLLAATGAGALAELTAGSDGKVLTTDAAQPSGLKWATPSGGTLVDPAAVKLHPNGHSVNVPTTNAVSTVNGEVWCARIPVAPGNPINGVIAYRAPNSDQSGAPAAAVGAGGLNGFAVYAEVPGGGAGVKLADTGAPGTDDNIWLTSGKIDRALTGIPTPTVWTAYWVLLSVRGYSGAPYFSFYNFGGGGNQSIAQLYGKYRGGGFATWPATFDPAVDSGTGIGYVLQMALRS
jgi:hypothetical protein